MHSGRRMAATLCALMAAAVWIGDARESGAATDADTCEATKLKQSGKLASCLLTNTAKSTKAGETPDQDALDACESKFTEQLSKAETKGDGACPTTGDATAIADAVTSCATAISADLSGPRFVDNGDGTVRDVEQGVTWQKTTAGTGTPSSVDEVRGSDDILLWLGTLNGDSIEGGLGGHSDWGLPTLAQLQSIVDCSVLPCTLVDAVLGPAPMPAVGGSTYLISGETGTLPMSTVPCLKLVRLEDGSVVCEDLPSVNGSSRARVMNNAR
jgi:hypothetical protein